MYLKEQTMNTAISHVDLQEHVSIKVGKFLIKKGFDLSSNDGFAEPSLKVTESIGILQKVAPIPRTYFFGLITIMKQPRRRFLGTIWFKDAENSAAGTNWIISLRGRENLDLIKQLAGEMTSAFNVQIRIRLISEHSRSEYFNPGYIG